MTAHAAIKNTFFEDFFVQKSLTIILLKDIGKLQIKMNLCQELSVFKSYKSWYHAAEMLFDINAQCEKLKKHFEGSGQNHGGSAPQ